MNGDGVDGYVQVAVEHEQERWRPLLEAAKRVIDNPFLEDIPCIRDLKAAVDDLK